MSESEQTFQSVQSGQHGRSRRAVVAGALGAGAGVAATLGAMAVKDRQEQASAQEPAPPLTQQKIPFYGKRQAGIETPAPAFAQFMAIDLSPRIDRQGLKSLLRILTDDAARLVDGQAPIVDQEPELASTAASMTITFGFGEKIFELAGAEKPQWLKPLPAFEKIDRLEERWNDGDLLLQVCCDDKMALAHAQRMLLKTIRSFGKVRWVQEGFRHSYGSLKTGQTMRNLFGQVDGTVNPTTEEGSMEDFVWGQYEGLEAWEEGGTSLVLRRIHMNLDTWDEADRPAREDAIGRKLSNGAPLTGEKEHDITDLSATNELGFEVIAPYAHIRRASPQKPEERILRRGYNYDLPVQDTLGFSTHGEVAGGVSQSGLIFASYQADPVKQFLPIQQRLAELDMLNTWTVPIGSAVFALPGGCEPGGFIGEKVFSH